MEPYIGSLAMGTIKQIQTGRPVDKLDAKILQTFIQLDPSVKAPIGLRVDAYFLTPPVPPLAAEGPTAEDAKATTEASEPTANRDPLR